jgi:hypothetical protein
MEENQIVEIWDVFLDFIPEKNRASAATQYIEYLLTDQFELKDLHAISGNDEYLDIAIEDIDEDQPDEENEEDY